MESESAGGGTAAADVSVKSTASFATDCSKSEISEAVNGREAVGGQNGTGLSPDAEGVKGISLEASGVDGVRVGADSLGGKEKNGWGEREV